MVFFDGGCFLAGSVFFSDEEVFAVLVGFAGAVAELLLDLVVTVGFGPGVAGLASGLAVSWAGGGVGGCSVLLPPPPKILPKKPFFSGVEVTSARAAGARMMSTVRGNARSERRGAGGTGGMVLGCAANERNGRCRNRR